MKRKFLVFFIVVILIVGSFTSVALADNPLLNIQFYLIDGNNYALPNYIVTIDNNTQSIANSNGVASFPAVDATGIDTFKVFTPEKKQVGICNLSYTKGDRTAVGASKGGGEFEIIYSTENATIHVYLIVDTKGDSNTLCHPGDASDSPLSPGKKASPSASPSASATASASASAQPTKTPQPTNPDVRGYVIDQDSLALEHVTVQSKNEDSGSSVSGSTNEIGFYTLPGISAGQHTITVYQENGSALGDIDVFVETGALTGLKDVDGDGVIDIHTGLGTLYLNLQVEDTGHLKLLDVSEQDIGSPARHADPTPEPTEEPAEEPTPEPTPAPTPEPAEEPTPEPTEAPTPEPQGGIDSNVMVIIIVAIVAVAAIVIAIMVIRSRTNNRDRY